MNFQELSTIYQILNEIPESMREQALQMMLTCAKTRKGKTKTRKIPITPMLRPYMKYFTPENLNFTDDRLSRVVPKYLEGHTTHHLRHTFITRAQECGVSKEVVKLWVGHSANKRDMTESVYTHFSEEFQLSEAKKISLRTTGLSPKLVPKLVPKQVQISKKVKKNSGCQQATTTISCGAPRPT